MNEQLTAWKRAVDHVTQAIIEFSESVKRLNDNQFWEELVYLDRLLDIYYTDVPQSHWGWFLYRNDRNSARGDT
jgi:hypothetical protein